MYTKEKFIDKLNNLDDNLIVKVKIKYLMEIIKSYGDRLYDKEYYELGQFLLSKLNTIQLLLGMGKTYMKMSLKEFKYIYYKTMDLEIDESMLIIIHQYDVSKTREKRMK